MLLMIWMRYVRGVSALCVALASGILSCGAQDRDPVGFDPTPVRISSIENSPSRPVTSMDLLAIRDVRGASISPDGKYVAFVVVQAVYKTNAYRTALYTIETAKGKAPTCLGSAGAIRWDSINQWVTESPQWSPDSRYITYTSKMDPTANWQVWRWNVSGGPPTELTNVPGSVQSYQWTPGSWKLHVIAEEPKDAAQIQKISEDGILYDGSFKASGGRPVVDEVLAAKPRETEAWIHDLATGEETREAKAGSDAAGLWFSDIGETYFDGTTLVGHHLLDSKVSPDGRRVAYRMVADSFGTTGALYQFFAKPVRGGMPLDLAPGVYLVGNYWWSPDSTKIYFEQNLGDGQSNTLMVVPAEGGRASQVFETERSLHFCNPDKDLRFVVCVSETSHSPSQLVLGDIASGVMRTILDLNPDFANLELGDTVRLEGVNRFGDRWWAHLVKPLNFEPGRKYPLIVTTYRTHEFLRGASGDENPVHVYAAHGFAVLSFDFGKRDYDNDPGDFERYLSWFKSVDASLEMAIQRAADLGIADTTRVGLTGYSRGTEIVSYEITHTNRFRAVSGAAGDYSPYFYYMAKRSLQEDFAKEGLGGWPEGHSRENWKKRAPELNADLISAAVLNNDPDSEFLADLALYTSLRELGKPVELFIYPNELHVVNQPKHRYQIYERNLDWFTFWLKSEESPDPAKTEQYRRWRQMRRQQAQSTGVSAAAF